MLKGKRILLGITGSIAAYKAATLVRSLVKEGAEVKVLMSKYAKEFISPLTLATLSKNVVVSDFFNPDNGDWNSHVDLGLWADAYLIAPATAHTLAKMASGMADNIIITSYLSARCPVFIAPAMDLDMYKHPTTQDNIGLLQAYGNIIIDAESGELASGLMGKGRMAEPDHIVDQLIQHFQSEFANKRVMITAGPTYEMIDPVRFVGNFSTGKMGYALAECLAGKGAEVILISGPTNLQPQHQNIHRVNIVSAQEMYEHSVRLFPTCDIAIMAAAVADYVPSHCAEMKIKSTDNEMDLHLIKSKDIAAELGQMKQQHQILMGFALETDNEEVNALLKMQSKNLDCIVLNSLNDTGAGFGGDTNKISILDKDGKRSFELKSKAAVAKDIVDYLKDLLNTHANPLTNEPF